MSKSHQFRLKRYTSVATVANTQVFQEKWTHSAFRVPKTPWAWDPWNPRTWIWNTCTTCSTKWADWVITSR